MAILRSMGNRGNPVPAAVAAEGNIVINVTAGLIAGFLAAILAFTIWALIYHTIPTENAPVLQVLIGCLTTNLSGIVAFYFGSSYAAKRQSETIDKQTDAINTALASTPPANGGNTVTATASVTVPDSLSKPDDISQSDWDDMTAEAQKALIQSRKK